MNPQRLAALRADHARVDHGPSQEYIPRAELVGNQRFGDRRTIPDTPYDRPRCFADEHGPTGAWWPCTVLLQEIERLETVVLQRR